MLVVFFPLMQCIKNFNFFPHIRDRGEALPKNELEHV